MIDHAPDHYREALRRGHVAVVKGRPREAIGHYEEAGRLAETRPLPFVSMGTIYLQMHQPREALASFEEALRRAPDDVAALRGKAAALRADGHAEEAARLARRVGELESIDVEQAGRDEHRTAGALQREMEEHVAAGDRARAAGDLDRATAAYHAAAIGYARHDHVEVALDACLRALEARPGAIDVHFTMAHLYLRRGWAELGVQRVLLIDHRLDVDPDPRRRAALRALAREYRELSPALERLAVSAA